MSDTQQVFLTDDQWLELKRQEEIRTQAAVDAARKQQQVFEAVLQMVSNSTEPPISKRDYYAGQALAGLLAGHYSINTAYNLNEVPNEAFKIADAMLAAREAGQ